MSVVREIASVAITCTLLSPSVSGTPVIVNFFSYVFAPASRVPTMAFAFTETRLTSTAVPVIVNVACFVRAGLTGETMVTIGGLRSIVTSCWRSVMLPAASVASTANTCGPSPRPLIDACHAVPLAVAATPSTVILTAVASLKVPLTTMGTVPMTEDFAGEATTTVGAIVSRVIVTVVVLLFVAASVATSVKEFAPSALRETSVAKAPLVRVSG